MMRSVAILVVLSLPLLAADEARLALTLKAEADFDRVDLEGVSRLENAGQCVQSQAAALAVAAPAEMALLHYRKGFCLIAGAATTRRPADYAATAEELEKAIQAWPSRTTPAEARRGAVEPVSPGLEVMAAIAHLKAGPDDAGLEHARKELAAANATPVCATDVMPAGFCQQMVQKGRNWLGWLALKNGDLREAAREVTGAASPWRDWVAGRQAFAEGNYRSAADHYHTAVTGWEMQRSEIPPGILQSFDPRPDWADTLTDLGGAQLLAGHPAVAIDTLDRAVREDASRARPLYLRARAKETAGDQAGALIDYNMASRAAFAAAQDLASGEAHFYRGILLYRRKDWARAEDEFSSALNFQIPTSLRPDAAAWRYMAAVAGGGCEVSRGFLEHSLEAVSPYFPKTEARAAAATCRDTAAVRQDVAH